MTSSPVKVLIVFVDETDMWENLPLYEAIIKRLAKHKIAGATAVEGMMGYGAHGKLHKRGLFGVSDDKPVMVVSVDHDEKIQRAILDIRKMVDEGLILVMDGSAFTPPFVTAPDLAADGQ
jgi:PII-like signaling protein